MLYLTHVPAWPLTEFVDLLWLFDGVKPAHEKERLLPDGCMEMVINLHQDEVRFYDRRDVRKFQKMPGRVLVGAQSEFFVIDTAEQRSVIGAHFKPGGAFQFFKIPADELHGLHVCLDDLWGPAAADLREQLIEAAVPERQFQIFEDALIAQARKRFERHPAVRFALAEFNSARGTVSEVSDRTGLSSRRFIEVFRSEVGLTPKLFCRIRRFQRLIHGIGPGARADWVDIALECGYFDQAHFIHDFQAFAGLTPSEYLAKRTRHLNHVPLEG
jgi:AraC-like DNA-binding protein